MDGNSRAGDRDRLGNRRVFSGRFPDVVYRTLTLDTARHLGVSWDVVKDIQKRDLGRRYAKPRLKDLRRIAIDEIAVGKGHRYLTVVLDLESGAVVFVGDGKGGDALKPFWKRLRRGEAKVEAVAMDMSPAYHDAVSSNPPEAAIGYDHFHVVKLFNDKLSDLRRSLYHKAEDEQQFRAQPGKALADAFLTDWIGRAEGSGVRMLQQMARTLEGRRSGLLAHYDFPLSTGPLEGTSNKIKTMKRQAYGFRDLEFFKLKILAIQEAKYALVG
jgi:transposase